MPSSRNRPEGMGNDLFNRDEFVFGIVEAADMTISILEPNIEV